MAGMEFITGNGSEGEQEDFVSRFLKPDENWILVNTPIPVITILVLYLITIFKIGPTLMASRVPYNLHTVMRIYDLIQVLFNGYIVMSLLVYPSLSWILLRNCCEFQVQEIVMFQSFYGYYTWNFLLSKIIDLLDTVFMVLRKKDSHITFLHVYHHAAMVFFVWFSFRYVKSHNAIIPGLINTFVHTIMYLYYFLATFPKLKKYLWWKKHLTTLQLVQFAVVLTYICLLYYNGCPVKPLFTYIWLFNTAFFFILFVNFYVKAYILKADSEVIKENIEKNL